MTTAIIIYMAGAVISYFSYKIWWTRKKNGITLKWTVGERKTAIVLSSLSFIAVAITAGCWFIHIFEWLADGENKQNDKPAKW